MPRKKKDENEEALADTTEAVDAGEDLAVEAAADDAAAAAADTNTDTEVAEPAVESEVEAAPAKEAEVEAAPAEETVEVAPAEAPTGEGIAEAPKKPVRKAAATKAVKKAKNGAPAAATQKSHGKRAEKVGIISSDKMMKTVTVRVDRLVKHPVYRKYVKKRKKFMAHDELGAKIGDKVKIVETRPLSARKRWRVVEIIHRAEN